MVFSYCTFSNAKVKKFIRFHFSDMNKRRRSEAITEPNLASRSVDDSSSGNTKKIKKGRSAVKELRGWVWSTGEKDDVQIPINGDGGRVFYHHATYFPTQPGEVPMRVSVEDVVATVADPDEEETKALKLDYWVGQVGALFEEKGEMKFILRFFDLPSQWRYQNDDRRLIRTFGDSFRRYEVLETDVSEINPIEIITHKVHWRSFEEDAIDDNAELSKTSDVPIGLFSDRMVVRCGAEGKRRGDLSDSLWPAPENRRRNRLLVQCPESKHSLLAGGISLETQIISTTSGSSDATYSRAVECLKLSVLPENLPCREEETASIREFVKSAVRSLGTSGNVLYISGVPGTGKTASVLSVVTLMQKTAKSDSAFQFAYINSMRLNSPTDLYQDLLNKLWIDPKRKFKAKQPQEKLTEYFSQNDKNRSVTVLLVDEIDYLVNKSQAVVYQLFDWPLLETSKLILLTISNTMDLPERLMPRVASRLGLARINYMPYNAEQIRRVIIERLKESGAESVFAPDAIGLAAARVANNSGDVRKALQICRRAIELREGPIVKAHDINRAQNDLYASPFVAIMAHLPYLARLVLIAIIKESEMRNTTSVILRDVYYRFTNLIRTFAPPFQQRPIYYSDFERVVNNLKNQSLVKVLKQTAASLASYQAEVREAVTIETPDLEDVALHEASTTRQSKKAAAQTQAKAMIKENNSEEDENGANYLIYLNELIEPVDVKRALVDEAGDKVAHRVLN